ncbi:SAM-dependent methyltransferase, partial [Pseudomonas sp. MWU13-2860]
GIAAGVMMTLVEGCEPRAEQVAAMQELDEERERRLLLLVAAVR